MESVHLGFSIVVLIIVLKSLGGLNISGCVTIVISEA